MRNVIFDFDIRHLFLFYQMLIRIKKLIIFSINYLIFFVMQISIKLYIL